MEHPENDEKYVGLTVNEGVAQPPIVNPYMKRKRRRTLLSAAEYVEGILKGNVSILSQAVTLVESQNPEHQAVAQEVIEKCLPHSGNSRRIGAPPKNIYVLSSTKATSSIAPHPTTMQQAVWIRKTSLN